MFSFLDPHLGYTRGDTEPQVQALDSRYVWHRGFAIYSKKALNQLHRPIILALGGSTTDPLSYGHSWPEELAKIFEEKGLSATVINGGTGGYSTNQELIKLIRDGLEFRPDIVISYSGVNDRGAYGPLPNPMVHTYQRNVFGAITRSYVSPFMPNTIHLLQSILPASKRLAVEGYTLGLDTSRTLGQWYERNLALMNAVTKASGASFFGVIQPTSYVGDYEWGAEELERLRSKSPDYVEKVRQLYAEISGLSKRVDYVYDFTLIFNGVNGIYTVDGVHVTRKGDRMIAEHMFELLSLNGADG